MPGALINLLWLPAAPLLFLQGCWTRLRTPRLTAAPGPCHGRVDGYTPPVRLGVFGESPAAGYGLADVRESVGCLVASSIARMTGRAVDWQIVARDGWTARDLCAALDGALHGPGGLDLALIALGVNDSLRLRSVHHWTEDVRALIERLNALAGRPRLLIAGVPPIDRFPVLYPPLSWFLGSRSRALDRSLAALVETWPQTARVPTRLSPGDRDLFATDGFHPSAIGHLRWADALTPAALALLGEKTSSTAYRSTT